MDHDFDEKVVRDQSRSNLSPGVAPPPVRPAAGPGAVGYALYEPRYRQRPRDGVVQQPRPAPASQPVQPAVNIAARIPGSTDGGRP
jgi:hypothetical protein